ncbi:C4-dicarboxylate ABC transporter substrate-binding protein [Exilibacterium tricleocarpae]|uniref:C4-dicarboxylate ABC transporter substrate-binding protein n=1 Tax=Exilibacterium tricleocarpae TaxID=2591008 RepID=A0A545SRZ4_9GAMM|nr:TRAP transporter substrate-binding protein DctP [Exilibacterium tricleocarpae]TQV67739.1 C4-dicarboxylate ABC transporter substrate-binding protein [Exilibacterium tricleocarpae]
MGKLRLIVFGLISAVCLVGGMATSVSSSEYTIKIGLLGSPDDEDYDGSLVFKDYVESRTNGRVAVKIYMSGQFCGNERECIEGLQSGILEVHMTTIGGLGNLFGPGQVLDLPYIFRDDQVAECVFDGPIVKQFRTAMLNADLNMRLMTVSNTGGWRNFATVDKQVRVPADLRGQKIRTTSAAIQQELVRQLGANPTPIAWSELYTAMATGVVEGTKNGVQDIIGAKLHENIKYLTLDGHGYMGALWWFSEPAWQQLPEDIRRVVFEGFNHLKTVTRALPVRRQIDAYEQFKAAGGTVYVPTPEEKAKFRQATAGMRTWFTENYGDTWMKKLDSAVQACEAEIDSEFMEINKPIDGR